MTIDHFEKNKKIKKKRAKKARNYAKEVSKSYILFWVNISSHNML